jgi:hypothetical protein
MIAQFLQQFDPANKDHVAWFKQMIVVAEDMGGHNLELEVLKNPMNLPFTQKDILDWPQIHCLLGTKYAKAVLRKEAYIPA